MSLSNSSRNFPLIENYNVYSDIVDVDFLQELQTSGLFDEDLKKNETSTRKKTVTGLSRYAVMPPF